MSWGSSFSNKLALITGAASGIGYEIATELLRAGACVCLLDNNEDAIRRAIIELNWAAPRVGAIIQSVGNPNIRDDITDYPSQHGFSSFNFLVNAAAISPKQEDGLRQSAWKISASNWQEVMQININGTFHTMSAVLPSMIERREGAIVNLSSLAARRYSNIAGAAYATSKGAVETMTRQFSGEVAQFGVRINAIAPGRINTPMAVQAGSAFNEEIRLNTPLRRLGTPIDISNITLFLLSSHAGFITGETIEISGGRGL